MRLAFAGRSRRLPTLMAVGLLGGSVAVGVSAVPAAATVEPSTPWTWGANSYGELGDGTTTTRTAPGPADLLTDVVDVHGGREHVVTLRDNGTVWVWGSNGEGQLGLGTTANRSTPTQVPGLNGVTAVETGHNHSVALTSGGSVWTWGLNADGQLGDGSTTLRRTPVQVSGLTNAVAIAAGRNMSYALRADGTVVGWGRNAEGQLGDGTTTRRLTPVPVGTLSNVTAISGGRDHGVAVRTDGSVWAWGANAYGQVGDGSTTNRTSPVRVSNAVVGNNVSDLIAGAHHSYALLADGRVASWGRNYRANLGDGTTTNRTRPVLVLGVSGAVSIGSGRDHGLAVLGDGRLRAWGYNASGQLGDGTTTNRSSSVLVPGVDDAVKAGGGGQAYSVILVGAGEPPVNQPPNAVADVSCTLLSCDFDGSDSTDSDGSVADHAWEFGDGAVGSGSTAGHTYAAPGTYSVTLAVTDDGGATDQTTISVTVSDEPPPAAATFRAAASTNAQATNPSVVVPSAVLEGDQLVLLVTTNRTATITVPAGWTQRGVVTDGTEVRSWLLTRVAGAATAGSAVTVGLDASSKVALSLHAYDAGGASAWASASETGSTAAHVAPASTVAANGSVVLRFWADKTSATHGWTLPGGLTQRTSSAGTGGGLLTTVSGDAPADSGPVGSATATAGVSASKAVAWTVVLPPG